MTGQSTGRGVASKSLRHGVLARLLSLEQLSEGQAGSTAIDVGGQRRIFLVAVLGVVGGLEVYE